MPPWTRHPLWPLPTVAAVLLTLGGALTPTGLDKPLRTLDAALKELPIAAAHSGRLYVANGLVLCGLGALGLSFVVIATIVPDRGAGLAAAAARVGLIGTFCGVIVNVLVGFDLAAAATARTSPTAAARVLVSATTSTAGNVLIVCYLGGILTAFVAMGAALWRSGRRPRWLPILFVVGSVAAAAAPPGPVGVVMSAPFVVAMVLLSLRVRADALQPTHPPRARIDGLEPAAG
jgi:hypothetical protein